MGVKKKTSTSLKKRSFAKRSGPSQESVEKRIADLLKAPGPEAILAKVKKNEKRPEEIAAGNKRRKGAIEVVDAKSGLTEIVSPDAPVKIEPTPEQAKVSSGLSLLRKAVREQSHLRKLPHQERHDYEFLLRRVATSGVVRLFNALTAAKTAGQVQFDKAEKTMTVDKAEERKFVASRDAFLSALRTSQPTARRL